MDIKNTKTIEGQETNEGANEVSNKTIECMAVLRATTIGQVNLGIKINDTETIGEEDHETLNVEIRTMTMRAMAEEDTGETAQTTEWIVEEAIGISMMGGLEWETKWTGVVKDSKNLLNEEVAIAVWVDETTTI